MKLGICGYGNLGKAVEKQIIKEKKDDLISIFSRRKNIKSIYKVPVEDYDYADLYKDEIDVMIMCGGSQTDLQTQSSEMLNYFNIIDTFDTHELTEKHKQNLEKISNLSNKTAIYSCGWDPGIFSIFRGISTAIFQNSPFTFWGKGISQGHSQALRNIEGVKDAIQFTVPREDAIQHAKKFPEIKIGKNQTHERICYVSLTGERNFKDIEQEILNIDHYFKGQQVTIEEVSQNQIDILKEKMYHQGEIFCGDQNAKLDINLQMDNNPTLTSQIVLAYTHTIPNLPIGVYSPLDIPISLLNNEKERLL